MIASDRFLSWIELPGSRAYSRQSILGTFTSSGDDSNLSSREDIAHLTNLRISVERIVSIDTLFE
jgi:hypothetical protein